MRRTDCGFTLIELMVAAAIVALLTAIALPAYRTYAIRARVAEALVLAGSIKGIVAENVAMNGGIISANGNCRGSGSTVRNSHNVASVACDDSNGRVTVSTTQKAGNLRIAFEPQAPSNTNVMLTWTCTVDSGNLAYVPSECR